MTGTFPPLQFRFARPEDAPALGEVLVRAYERRGDIYKPDERADNIVSEANSLQMDILKGFPVLMASLQQQPVGFINYKEISPQEIEVERFYTIRSGTGSALLSRLCKMQENIDCISLWSSRRSQDAYLRLGFRYAESTGDMLLDGASLDFWRNSMPNIYPRYSVDRYQNLAA